MLAAEFYEANFFQKIKLIFVSDIEDMDKVYQWGYERQSNRN